MSKKPEIAQELPKTDISVAPPKTLTEDVSPAGQSQGPQQNFQAAALPKTESYSQTAKGIYMLGHILKCALAAEATNLTPSIELGYHYDAKEKEHIFSLFLKKHMPKQHKWDKDMRSAMRAEARHRIEAFLENLDMMADDDKIFIDVKNSEIVFREKIDLYELVVDYLQENGNSILEIGNFSLQTARPIPEFNNAVPDNIQYTNELLRTKSALARTLVQQKKKTADDFLTVAFNRPFIDLKDYLAHVAVVDQSIGNNVMLFSTMMALTEEQIKLEDSLDRAYGSDAERNMSVLTPALN